MKPTKRPKRVSIIYKKCVEYYSSYTCPTCYVRFVGAGVGKKVTRFICNCGQELIVNKE